MTKDIQEVWSALSELGDHFARLGGSARYLGMSESELPLFVASLLLQRHTPSFETEGLTDKRFIDAAGPVLDRVRTHIDAVSAKGEPLGNLILEFVQYADSRLKPQHKSSQWRRFVGTVSRMNSNDAGTTIEDGESTQ